MNRRPLLTYECAMTGMAIGLGNLSKSLLHIIRDMEPEPTAAQWHAHRGRLLAVLERTAEWQRIALSNNAN